MKVLITLKLLGWVQRSLPPVINACSKLVSLATRVVDVCQRLNVWTDKKILWYRFGKKPEQLNLLKKDDVR